MKNLKITLLTVTLLFGLSSCENWLDVSSSSQLDRADLFQTEDGYSEAMTGVYAKMCDASLYGRTLTFYVLDILAGYYSFPWGDLSHWSSYGYGDPTNQKAIDYCKPVMEAVWATLYNQIANLNSLLETIDGNREKFSGDNYELIKGEAIGLRAYLHFELLRLFAEAYETGKDKKSIPYVKELTPAVTPLFTQEDLIAAVLVDLETAKTLLVNDPMRLGTAPSTHLAPIPSGQYISDDKIEIWHGRRFRFNYYAAVATMARVYMWKGDKSNALQAAREIIADQEVKFPWVLTENLVEIGNLNSAWYRNQDRSFATEHIFALNMTKMEDLMDSYIFNGSIGINYFTQNALKVSTDMRSGVYENMNADLRYLYWFENFNNEWLVSKFYQNAVTARYFQERLPLIRLSEMYYIAAECADNASDAIDYLNVVRSHRGLNSYALQPGADIEEELRKEYRKEFWGEGQLWYYYKRTGYTSFSASMTDKAFFTWPIPDDEISIAGCE